MAVVNSSCPDTRVLAFRGQALAAHVGFQRRRIAVGTDEVMVAGTAGVLVDEPSHGTGLGRRAMRHAVARLLSADFDVSVGHIAGQTVSVES
jgi:predicted N-acetyltransferase YhbS